MVIPKSLAPKELVKVLEAGDAVVLPPWDPMVILAIFYWPFADVFLNRVLWLKAGIKLHVMMRIVVTIFLVYTEVTHTFYPHYRSVVHINQWYTIIK